MQIHAFHQFIYRFMADSDAFVPQRQMHPVVTEPHFVLVEDPFYLLLDGFVFVRSLLAGTVVICASWQTGQFKYFFKRIFLP